MARFRASFGRILTIGGLAAASSSVAVYQSLYSEKTSAHAQVLESPVDNLDDPTNPRHKWDSDWDRRSFRDLKKKISAKNLNVIDEDVSRKQNNTEIDGSTNKEVDKVDRKRPTATRHLIFVRHGQYNNGKSDDEKTLTGLGRKQAACTGDRLKSLNIKFDRMVHSTMTRARETAEVIKESLEDVNCESCSLLREGAPCPPEPSSSSNWKPERWEYFQDGSRIEAAFRKYFHRADVDQLDDSHELIVCHANVIRYFVCRALQFPPEGWLRMSIANCGLTHLTIRPNGRVSMKSLGDAGHLPPDQITFK